MLDAPTFVIGMRPIVIVTNASRVVSIGAFECDAIQARPMPCQSGSHVTNVTTPSVATLALSIAALLLYSFLLTKLDTGFEKHSGLAPKPLS